MLNLKLILPSALLTVLLVASAPASAATSAAVTIPGFLFSPAVVNIDFDQNANTVTFTNTHTVNHWPRSDGHNLPTEGACMDGPVIPPGGSATLTITWSGQCIAALAQTNGIGAGTFTVKYHCHIHAGMLGSIVVHVA
jgi:plastocyanin